MSKEPQAFLVGSFLPKFHHSGSCSLSARWLIKPLLAPLARITQRPAFPNRSADGNLPCGVIRRYKSPSGIILHFLKAALLPRYVHFGHPFAMRSDCLCCFDVSKSLRNIISHKIRLSLNLHRPNRTKFSVLKNTLNSLPSSTYTLSFHFRLFR